MKFFNSEKDFSDKTFSSILIFPAYFPVYFFFINFEKKLQINFTGHIFENEILLRIHQFHGLHDDLYCIDYCIDYTLYRIIYTTN